MSKDSFDVGRSMLNVRCSLLGLLAALALVALLAMPAFADETKDDVKTLQGKWLPTTAEVAGNQFPNEILKTIKLFVNGEKYATNVATITDHGTLKLDATKTPKTMDILGIEGPNKGKTILAIYELSGDALKVCYALEGERPTAFKTEAGDKRLLITFQREKP